MGIIGNAIIGLLITGAGVLLLKYNYQVSNNIPLSFAEKHLGTSYAAWKILAIVVVLAGLTIMFGVYDNILGWILSPLTNAVSGS